MKKYLCILLLALLFSLGTLAGGHLWVNGARDRMDIRETVITGDPAAAAGLAVTYRTRDQEGRLLWETTYTPGGAERAETDFRFSAEGEQRSYYGRDIVSLEQASGNFSAIAKIMHLADGCVDLYSGNDDQIVPLMSLGGKGVISVLSNVAPAQTHEICASYLRGDVKKSMEMQLEALPLIDALFCEVNPIPVKAALNLMGKEAGPLRLPLTEMEPGHQEILAKAMRNYGIL